MPQHGTPDGCTSSAHLPTRAWNCASSFIFFELHGTWIATDSFFFSNSNLLPKNVATNSTGSYSANFKRGSRTWSLTCFKQGDVSQTMGYLPFSEAFRSFSSSFTIAASDASTQPREWNMMPQHCSVACSG